MFGMPTNPLRRHRREEQFDDARTDESPVDREREREDTTRQEPVAAGRPMLERQRVAYGGTRLGAGLFGWLAAVGTFVVIAAIVDAVTLATGGTMASNIRTAFDASRTTSVAPVAWSGAIALLILVFVSFLAGGYVAGRMARFNGIRQGLVVWVWGAVAAVVASLIVESTSTTYAVLYRFDLFPRLHVGSINGTGGEIVTAIVLAAAGLVGALIGGLAGMAYHRRVDRTELR